MDHREHTVRYLSPGDGFGDLPADSERRLLGDRTDETRVLADRHADWLSQADRLIACSEYDLLPAARLREEFGIAGDLLADVLPVHDKWLMRNLAEKAGIPQPRFWSTEEIRRNPPRDGTYLIKPRLEASSTDIELGDIDWVLDKLDNGAGTGGVFVEEFVPGEIWHPIMLVSADVIDVAFEAAASLREFPSYRGQRHFRGLY